MVGGDVSVGAGNDDVIGIAERAAGIEGALRVPRWIKHALQIIIQRIAVEQGRRVHED